MTNETLDISTDTHCCSKAHGVVTKGARRNGHAAGQTDNIDAHLYQLLVRGLINPAIFLVDLSGTLISWNAGVRRILGYSEAEFVGRHLAFIFDDEDKTNGVPEHLIQRAILAGSLSHYLWCRREDSTYLYSRCVVTEVRDVSGSPLGIAVVLQDATDDKRSNDERTLMARSLQQSNEDLTSLGQVLAHDLRAPLRMVGSYVQLLGNELDGRLDATSRECMNHVLQGIDHMDRLITALLAYAQADSIQLTSVEVNLEEILQRTLIILAVNSDTAEVTHDALPSVQGDSVLLLELMQNVIANALKYRTDDKPQIHVSVQESGREWTISVRDNGIGIDPQYAEKIFLPLTRLHGANISGSGIGLAVCKRVVERHGGRIWLESTVGCGSTFYFSLPKILISDGGQAPARLRNPQN